MSARPHVVIYRDFLLPASETFIRSQAEGLRRFLPFYFGLKTIEGVPLPAERVVAIDDGGFAGRVESAAFTRLGFAPRAAWRLKQLRARLVHAHFGVDGTRIMGLARLLHLPLVVTLHDYDVTTSDAELLELGPYLASYIRRRPRLSERASVFLAVSNFIKQQAVARGFAEQKIVVHHIGIDVNVFQPDQAEPREPMVLFVGRLVEKKGCEYLIRAMAAVQRTRPDVELVVVGEGPLRPELEAQAAATLKRYRFVGVQTSQQVRQWHQRMQVFCVPSVTAQSGETEGLPIAILEAQAMAVPVVSTHHSGIPEAVIHGQTGLLAAERDSEALSAELSAVLGNADLGARLGAAARKLVQERFNLHRQNALLEEIYARVIAQPRSTPQVTSDDIREP